MQLPHADSAIVSKEKIVGYLLNPMHPDGASKARFFQSLGFHADQWYVLAGALKQVAERSPVTLGVESEHGQKYIIEGTIATSAGRSAAVRTVWIVDRGESIPRLVTAYPGEHEA